jgi:ubiquinone/menaquinone biosynthesis C-methylase UbiE
MAHGERDGRWLDYGNLSRLLHPDRERLFPRAGILALLRVSEGMTVVDVGAGSGYMATALAVAVGRAGVVLAVDPSPAARQHLLERQREGPFPQIDVREGTGEQTGLDTGCADRVLWQAVYHELHDVPAALAEARRLLKPGGLLVVVDWDPAWVEQGPPAHERVDLGTARQAVAAAGFVVEEARPVSDACWGLVAARP